MNNNVTLYAKFEFYFSGINTPKNIQEFSFKKLK